MATDPTVLPPRQFLPAISCGILHSMSETVLTGVKPTGVPHLGNYVGAIRPALQLANTSRGFLFIADYHALTNIQEPGKLGDLTRTVAATWVACGLDPEKVVMYRQSDIPEVFELAWVLSCFTEKGLMNRAHAYKARVGENEEAGKDADRGINMGLYGYPVLMTADIVLYDADKVPVGQDQVQHLEIARDVVGRFNHTYGATVLKAPTAHVQKDGAVIPGLDGRKMSKSYDNTIPLFLESKKLRKLIMKIKTDSSAPEDPKDPATSEVFQLFCHFAKAEEQEALAQRYRSGIGWGEAKQALFEAVESELAPARDRFNALMAEPAKIDVLLAKGAERARPVAQGVMERVRRAIGQHA